MDNNQNNVYNQQPYGGQPQQQTPFGYAQQQPKAPAKFNLYELLALCFAGVALVMVVLGTIFTCTCSAKTIVEEYKAGLSGVVTVSIIGVVFAVAAVVMAILAYKLKSNVPAGKMAAVSFIVGAVAAVFGLMPVITICGYNCSINNYEGRSYSDLSKSEKKEYEEYQSEYYKILNEKNNK